MTKEERVEAVWRKGTILHPNPPQLIRFDVAGVMMDRGEYGNRNHLHGWEIDHIRPVAHGGTDDVGNLQPLNWKTNLARS